MSVLSIALVRTKIFAYSECSFTTVSNCSQLFSVCSDLTGKILVFWIDGRLRQVVSHRGYLFTVFIYQLFWTKAFPEGMYTNGTQVPCEVPSALNPTTRKGWPHHRGLYDPCSFRIVMWVLLRPTRTNHWKCCETGPTVFRPYPRRLESLTICSCHYKGSTSFLVI